MTRGEERRRLGAAAGPLPLLTDLYQLTMAHGYWRSGRAELPAVFHLAARRPPFGGAFLVACGLDPAAEWLEQWRFEEEDLAYLATLETPGGRPLFEPGFLEYLETLRLRCDVDAVVEGTICFGREPLLRVEGPLLQAQLLETALLNQIAFPSLIATKAARVCHLAASGQAVMEFGLRRAQGLDGGLSASRAAVVGGCVGTSNVLAGQRYGVRVLGTHAHSWVLSFAGEKEAFRTFAEGMPEGCVLLVDTFDTRRGVEHAIEVGLEMRARGQRLDGIRLDSGDLAALSVEAREMLDRAGLEETRIVASGDLDEFRISDLRAAGARIDIWGVGTRLATGAPDAALGAIYKLAMVGDGKGGWRRVAKRSEESQKSSDPGRRQVRRYWHGGKIVADVVWDRDLGEPQGEGARVERVGDGVPVAVGRFDRAEDLLTPWFRAGERVRPAQSIHELQQRVAAEVAALPEEARRLRDAAEPLVAYEERLAAERRRMLASPSSAAALHERRE